MSNLSPLIKTLTIDGFYSKEGAVNLSNVAIGLKFEPTDIGKEIRNFNHVPANANDLFSNALNRKVEVIRDRSGVFRIPEHFIHFESFDSLKEWIFVVALEPSTFNLFEHQSGAKNATEGYKFQYRNLFEWDLKVNYLLDPGQGIFFRPWLFHSFDGGLIQVFRMNEIDEI